MLTIAIYLWFIYQETLSFLAFAAKALFVLVKIELPIILKDVKNY